MRSPMDLGEESFGLVAQIDQPEVLTIECKGRHPPRGQPHSDRVSVQARLHRKRLDGYEAPMKGRHVRLGHAELRSACGRVGHKERGHLPCVCECEEAAVIAQPHRAAEPSSGHRAGHHASADSA